MTDVAAVNGDLAKHRHGPFPTAVTGFRDVDRDICNAEKRTSKMPARLSLQSMTARPLVSPKRPSRAFQDCA